MRESAPLGVVELDCKKVVVSPAKLPEPRRVAPALSIVVARLDALSLRAFLPTK